MTIYSVFLRSITEKAFNVHKISIYSPINNPLVFLELYNIVLIECMV